jgi:hypothetical protein
LRLGSGHGFVEAGVVVAHDRGLVAGTGGGDFLGAGGSVVPVALNARFGFTRDSWHQLDEGKR